jgi:3-hydroxyisobutyrate dehydrogenase-like beta-hydroxyacid dehydrogenase
MATRLLDAGHELVVHTRTREHASEAEERGAAFVETPREVARRCPIVLGCLLDTSVVDSVYLGREGLFTEIAPGQIFVEHGTFFVGLAQRLAAEAQERGASFLDAPVSGGPDGVAQGSLVTMVGGDPGAVAVVRPLLESYSRAVVRAGDPGTGLGLKMVNQHLVAAHVVAAAEAIALAERLAIPMDVASEVLISGLAASAILARSLPRVMAADYAGSGMPLGGLVEVLRLVSEMSSVVGSRTRLLPVVREVFAEAVELGLGESDLAALVEFFRGPVPAETAGRRV